jgi:hypothetical protein
METTRPEASSIDLAAHPDRSGTGITSGRATAVAFAVPSFERLPFSHPFHRGFPLPFFRARFRGRIAMCL